MWRTVSKADVDAHEYRRTQQKAGPSSSRTPRESGAPIFAALDTAKWSTSNSAYGMASRLPNFEPSPRRPMGIDIGTSRESIMAPRLERIVSFLLMRHLCVCPCVPLSGPWPSQNTALLSPRVPASWILESPKGSARPASRENILSHVRANAHQEARQLAPSSQRDAARGYSIMLAQSLGGKLPPFAPRPSTSNVGTERNWWRERRNANVGPRRNGA